MASRTADNINLDRLNRNNIPAIASPQVHLPSGEQAGRVAGVFGEVLRVAGNAVAEINHKNQEMAAAKTFSDIYLEAQTEINNFHNSATGSEDIAGQSLAIYDKYIEGIDKRVPNGIQADYIKTKLMALRDNIGISSLDFDLKLKAKKYENDLSAKIETAANIVAGDPSSFKIQLSDVEAVIVGSRLNAAEKEDKLNKARQLIGQMYVSRLAETNPAKARTVLQSGELDSIIDPKIKLVALNASENKIQSEASKAIDERIIADPAQFIADVNEGKIQLPEKQKQKYLSDAVTRFKTQEDRNKIISIASEAALNKDVYENIMSNKNSPAALDAIEAFRGKGGSPELADYMRDAVIKSNPVSADDQAETYSRLSDRVANLGLKLRGGKVSEVSDAGTVEEAMRLQTELIKNSARGVSGLRPFINRVAPLVTYTTKRELGNDDVGFWDDDAQPYDTGYQVIQDYLVKQGKENDYPAKARMLSRFITKADGIGDEVRKDADLFNQKLQNIANDVIADQIKADGRMANIPLPAIKFLRADPSDAARKEFDGLFGAGAASRVLGGTP